MAEKEATIFIVDVGGSMGNPHSGREESDLNWSMRYVWDRIASAISTGRKTLFIGVLGLKTDKTHNALADDDESYDHISVLHDLSQILMPDLRSLKKAIKSSQTNDGDAISALIVAVNMITTFCKHLKYKRQIVLVTDGKGHIEDDQVSQDQLVTKIKEEGIELTILGVDFDDADYGFKEEGKSGRKAGNEKVLRELTERCNGAFGTVAQAVEELDQPRLKTTKPVNSYRGTLTLGDPKTSDTAITINVERYPKTMVAKAPTASSYVLCAEVQGLTQSTGTVMGDGQGASARGDNGLTNVRSAYSYTVSDESAPGGKIEVERDALAKGYEYGRTIVPITQSDETITKLETEMAMEIVGFVEKSKLERYLIMGVSNIVIAPKGNTKAILALSSLIHALFETEHYAIARVVKKANAEPLLTVLSPSIEPDYECLIENQLPFGEDVRQYKFPPLDKILTVSGKVIKQHRNLPSKDLSIAVDKFVDAMDLSRFDRTDEGEPTEYMALDDVFSPLLHRIEQAKRWRAVRPNDPVPPIPDILLKYSHQPEDLQEQAKPALDRLIRAADVKKVPPKAKGRKRRREPERPLSGLDVESLFGTQRKRAKISAENAIPEFRQLMTRVESTEEILDAVKQMATIVEEQIRSSLGDQQYNLVVEELGVMRGELVELEEPKMYNDAVRRLRDMIAKGELGGDRREMWWKIRQLRVGLIDKRVSSVSDVSEDEARDFMGMKMLPVRDC